MLQKNKIYQGDCLEVMKLIGDKSIDCIIADLPYGTTACKWDEIIPFDLLWEQFNRIVKPNTPIVLFGREPFTSKLVTSNIKKYRHKWVWNKKQTGSFQNAKYMPLQIEEDIIVFSQKLCNYYPMMRIGKMRKRGGAKKISGVLNGMKTGFENYSDKYFPTNILEITNLRNNRIHPTQKPAELIEYLIKTYTNEGDLILDCTAGSMTLAVASDNLSRNWLCIEKDENYCKLGLDRVNKNRLIKGLDDTEIINITLNRI